MFTLMLAVRPSTVCGPTHADASFSTPPHRTSEVGIGHRFTASYDGSASPSEDADAISTTLAITLAATTHTRVLHNIIFKARSE